MKQQFKKAVAVAMAATMCVPATAFADSGTFDTSFDVYAPVLTISVPTNADIRINPIANQSGTGVDKFTVASNDLDIINASVDVEKDIGIPVTATIQAAISSQKADVVSEYNSFTADPASTKKRIYLALAEAQTAGVIALKQENGSAVTPAFDADKKLDLSKFEISTPAVYTTPAQKNAVTKYGSLLSVDIAKPDTSDSTQGAKYSTDASKITPKSGSFAIIGEANTNADWKADDITVSITYNVKASEALSIETPTVTAVTVPASNSADVVITIPGVGEATVAAMAIHNNGEKLYGDYMLEDFKVEYIDNSGATDAKITIAKDHPTLAYLANEENGCKGKAQDLIIGLTDGRMVVTSLTVN